MGRIGILIVLKDVKPDVLEQRIRKRYSGAVTHLDVVRVTFLTTAQPGVLIRVATREYEENKDVFTAMGMTHERSFEIVLRRNLRVV